MYPYIFTVPEISLAIPMSQVSIKGSDLVTPSGRIQLLPATKDRILQQMVDYEKLVTDKTSAHIQSTLTQLTASQLEPFLQDFSNQLNDLFKPYINTIDTAITAANNLTNFIDTTMQSINNILDKGNALHFKAAITDFQQMNAQLKETVNIMKDIVND